jgi:hypothetical protein
LLQHAGIYRIGRFNPNRILKPFVIEKHVISCRNGALSATERRAPEKSLQRSAHHHDCMRRNTCE